MLCFIPFFIGAVLADKALWTLVSPVANQLETPGHAMSFNYTINAMSTDSQQQTVLGNKPNYPSSLDVYFQWTSKNESQKIQLTATKSLVTDPYPGGIKDKSYEHIWRLPNCRFFKRYQPEQWTFSLLFQPVYENTTAKPMTVPLTLSLNQTLPNTHGKHHRNNQECL
ncbi:unnamed protein product [Rhizopus stolonifer]